MPGDSPAPPRDGRLFADDYSATGQRAWLEGDRGAGPDYWKDDYRGQLRFDSLLSPTLVIPDTHVFDGVYFLSVGPVRVAADLGRSGLDDHAQQALEIRGREETVEASLASFLRRDDTDTLNAFVFKSLDVAFRHQLAAELGRTPETDLDRALSTNKDVAAGVASLVRECLRRVDPGLDGKALVAPLEEGWRRWVREAAHVEVKKWPIYRRFDIEAEIERERSIERNMRTPAGKHALASVLATIAKGSGHRSDISQLLAAARDSARLDEPALLDLDLVDVWYSRLRYRALASRHGCVCSLADRPWLPAVGPGQALIREALRLDDPAAIPLPPDVLNALGDLEGREFEEFVRRERRSIVGWWRTRGASDLHQLADSLALFSRARDRPPLGIAQLLPLSGAVAGAAFGGLGAPVGGLLGTGGKSALDRRKSEPEKVRIRVLEAMKYRVADVAP